MDPQTFIEWAYVVAASLAAALATLYWLNPKFEQAEVETRKHRFLDGDPVWIFDETRLADATPPARNLIRSDERILNWNDVRTVLLARFPEFPAAPGPASEESVLHIPGGEPDDRATLTVETIGGMTRVQLHEMPESPEDFEEAVSEEIRSLRETLNLTPYPMWTLAGTGAVDQTNFAYDKLAELARHDARDVPIFPILQSDIDTGKTRRVPIINQETGQKHWYDICVRSGEKAHICFAIDVDPVVQAEDAQRNFVQTLAKTFAQLSIGLAIFDRNRQLALFNPALIDLTSLPADFLSARPTLFSFFDRLRDKRMMPEPKDYGTWRQKISSLIEAASDGSYQETWTLPSGSVYSISGRPHPDGAIAFLFEDITAEITLTRRFRSDIEQCQAILDHLDDAIVVFGNDGTITSTNHAYRALWRTDPERSFASTTVIDATRLWQDNCKATPIWGEIRDFAAVRDNRTEWFGDVALLNGKRLRCQTSPLQNGATMVVFSALGAPVSTPEDSLAILPQEG
ncbi:MAG: PAS-domain containing protein [Arenibacterium sp.]